MSEEDYDIRPVRRIYTSHNVRTKRVLNASTPSPMTSKTVKIPEPGADISELDHVSGLDSDSETVYTNMSVVETRIQDNIYESYINTSVINMAQYVADPKSMIENGTHQNEKSGQRRS